MCHVYRIWKRSPTYFWKEFLFLTFAQTTWSTEEDSHACEIGSNNSLRGYISKNSEKLISKTGSSIYSLILFYFYNNKPYFFCLISNFNLFERMLLNKSGNNLIVSGLPVILRNKMNSEIANGLQFKNTNTD